MLEERKPDLSSFDKSGNRPLPARNRPFGEMMVSELPRFVLPERGIKTFGWYNGLFSGVII